jgi:hypothetical protein
MYIGIATHPYTSISIQSSFARESKLTISCFYHTFSVSLAIKDLPATMGNGLYFINCHNDQGVERSAIAFYDDLGENNLNLNEQPQAFVYTDLVGDTIFESDQKQRK